jgi:hypothetical protein
MAKVRHEPGVPQEVVKVQPGKTFLHKLQQQLKKNGINN